MYTTCTRALSVFRGFRISTVSPIAAYHRTFSFRFDMNATMEDRHLSLSLPLSLHFSISLTLACALFISFGCDLLSVVGALIKLSCGDFFSQTYWQFYHHRHRERRHCPWKQFVVSKRKIPCVHYSAIKSSHHFVRAHLLSSECYSLSRQRQQKKSKMKAI